MNIADFDYSLPDERIAKFPLPERDGSKLLVWRNGTASQTCFRNIAAVLPKGSLLILNNTRVVRARLEMFKPTGARIEILCLEPSEPADYERALSARGNCEWVCMVGNLKKWKDGPLETTITSKDNTPYGILRAWRVIGKCDNPKSDLSKLDAHKNETSQRDTSKGDDKQIIRFEWSAPLTFGELLEALGRIPIPPYLNRDAEEIDTTRYQTVYARSEGSVAAPTAGLHFTPGLISRLKNTEFDEVTLHVGAGTFLPVKTSNALQHPMHTEHFEVTLATVEHILSKLNGSDTIDAGPVIAVGTTSVRTLESLAALGYRIAQTGGTNKTGNPHIETPVGQFELNEIPETFDGAEALQFLTDYMKAGGLDKIVASTKIMITPGFTFRIVGGIVTNFHQPRSTLLLLIAAFVGLDRWRKIYDHALRNDFRFLSYGDSSLLLGQ